MFLSPVDASSDSLYIYLARVSAALLGVGQRDGFSSNNVYTHLLARITSAFYCFFTRFISTPWIFACAGFSVVPDLDSLLRDPCLRVLLRIEVSNVIGGGYEIVGNYF